MSVITVKLYNVYFSTLNNTMCSNRRNNKSAKLAAEKTRSKPGAGGCAATRHTKTLFHHAAGQLPLLRASVKITQRNWSTHGAVTLPVGGTRALRVWCNTNTGNQSLTVWRMSWYRPACLVRSDLVTLWGQLSTFRQRPPCVQHVQISF